jgi:hypothetical protein
MRIDRQDLDFLLNHSDELTQDIVKYYLDKQAIREVHFSNTTEFQAPPNVISILDNLVKLLREDS